MEKEIDLRDILIILRRRIGILVALPLIAVLAAAIMVFYVITPVYEASTTLLVGKNESTSLQQSTLGYQDVLLNQQLVKTYGEIAKSRTIADDVAQKMGLSLTAEQLRTKVNVTLVTGTQIIRLTATDTNPLIAQQVANATASVFVKRVPDLMKLNNVTVVDQATTPLVPVKPQKTLTMAVAFMVGLMLALGLAFVLEYLDNTLKTKEDVEMHLGLPVIGLIPKIETQG